MIKAITFDLDGVYFPNGKANFITALEKYGISKAEATRVFLKSDEMNKQYKLGKMTDDEFWTWAAQEWGLNTSPRELTHLLVASYAVDPQVEEIVKSARSQGYKTLICSNNFPARVHGLNERFRFLDNFDAAVFSYEVGATKPSEAIFAELIKKSGVPATSIVFSDDSADKLAGAEALGIETFVYENFEQFKSKLRKLGISL